MAATTVGTFGISQHSGSLIESVEITKKIDEKMVLDKDGTFGQAHGYNPTQSFSVRGRGTSSVAVGDIAASLTSVSGGKIFVTTTRITDSNSDINSFEYSGEHYPGAT
jgi:hypothetical protein